MPASGPNATGPRITFGRPTFRRESGVHTRRRALRGSRLAVFDARLYIEVRRLDESAERCGVCGGSRPQLHVAHVFAGSLQQTGRVRQRRDAKESHVYVRSEYIHVAEGRIAQACNRTAVMKELPNLVPASSHHLKPLTRDGAQFAFSLV